MDRYFVKVDMAYQLLLKKQHELLTSRHSNVAVIAWPEEVEIRVEDVIQDEARQQKVAEMGPTRGMWFQEARKVGLRGYGFNYRTNLRANPCFSKMEIFLGEFPNDDTKLSTTIKSQTHKFETGWPEFIFQNGGGQQYVLNKALDEIAEDTHLENVRVKLETKQYLKMGSRSNPRDENVQVPARRSREEIRQEVDLERRKEEMKKEEKMKAESEAFYLKLSIQA